MLAFKRNHLFTRESLFSFIEKVPVGWRLEVFCWPFFENVLQPLAKQVKNKSLLVNENECVQQTGDSTPSRKSKTLRHSPRRTWEWDRMGVAQSREWHDDITVPTSQTTWSKPTLDELSRLCK